MDSTLKLIYQATRSVSDCVDTVIATNDVEALILRAERGDRAAAKELLGLASAYLMSDTFGPLPKALGRYLATALARTSLGESADITLNLKKRQGGKPRQDHRTKLMIGHEIYKAVKDGDTLEAATSGLEDQIKAKIKRNGSYYGYKKAPSMKTLEGIYCEVLSELQSKYQGVESTLKT